MTEYYEVIEDYLTRWPTESKFIKAHEKYRVEGKRGYMKVVNRNPSWILGEDYMEGDVIFAFRPEVTKRAGRIRWKSQQIKIEGILYIINEDEYGYRHVLGKSIKKTQWILNKGWGKSSTSWGLKTLWLPSEEESFSPKPFIIVIPYNRMLGDSSLLNWNKIPWGDLK